MLTELRLGATTLVRYEYMEPSAGKIAVVRNFDQGYALAMWTDAGAGNPVYSFPGWFSVHRGQADAGFSQLVAATPEVLHSFRDKQVAASDISVAGGMVTAREFVGGQTNFAACPQGTSCIPDSGIAVVWSSANHTTGAGRGGLAVQDESIALARIPSAFGSRTLERGRSGGEAFAWKVSETPNGPFNAMVSGARSDTVFKADGGFGANIAVTEVTVGRASGANAATETTRYSYTSTTVAGVAIQLVDSELVGSAMTPGADVVTKYQYDGTRISGIVKQGRSRKWNAPSFTDETRSIGTFYRTASCSTADPLGRTLQVDGPCLVTGFGNGCSEANYPITRLSYYPAGSGNNSHRLQSVTRTTSASPCSGGFLTTYAAYDARGNATQVTDENNVVSTRTFAGARMVSETRSGLTWTYTYDHDHLAQVNHPGGNVDVVCYRANPTLAGGCPATTQMSEEPTAMFRYAAGQSGGGWYEATLLTYAIDGKVREEATYSPSDVTTPFRRVTRERNPYGHETFVQAGGDRLTTDAGTIQPHISRGFAPDGLLVAEGTPYVNAPDFCGLPGAPSDVCTRFDYWNTGRLQKMSVKPLSTSSSDITVCLDYDGQGNVVGVKPNCVTAGMHSYVWDDFGNVIEAKLANVDPSTPIRFAYDARGNLTHKGIPNASGQVLLEWDYDAHSRPTANRENGVTVLQWQYDTAPNPPTNCVVNAGAMLRTGRLATSTDAVWKTWYSYDALGRVIREARVSTAVGASCSTTPGLNQLQRIDRTYTDGGVLASVTYPTGRRFDYSTDSTQRTTSVSMTTWNGSAWASPVPVIQNVTWHPGGLLKSYDVAMSSKVGGTVTPVTVSYRYGSNASGDKPTDAIPSGEDCASASASDGPGDSSGRLRAIYVTRSGTNVMRLFYRWKGEHLAESSRCYLNGLIPQREYFHDPAGSPDPDYQYDRLGRLGGGNQALYDSTGGYGYKRVYRYDSRGNRTKVMQYATTGYDFVYDAGVSWAPDRLTRMAVNDGTSSDAILAYARNSAGVANVPVRSGRSRDYTYDVLGRTSRITGGFGTLAVSFDGGVGYTGSETVVRSVGTAGGVFTYYYDAENRRVRKQHPNGDVEGFTWGDGKELLMETAPSSVGGAGLAIDEYLWLGGRPVLMRSSATDATGLSRPEDWGTSCTRRDEAGTCRPTALVTDVIGKPVLSVDWARRIAGVLEYDPYGFVNRTEHWGEIAPHFANGCVWVSTWMSPGNSDALSRDVRVRAPRVDVAQGGSSGCVSQWKSTNSSPNTTAPPGNNFCGNFPNFRGPWASLASSEYLHFMYCTQDNGTAYSPQAFGVTSSGYDYRRYESGAVPYLPPLRFPGQYFDAETEFHENWNRYYDPQTGRYLSPEPMLSEPAWLATETQSGFLTAAYSYARDTPTTLTDPSGLFVPPGFPPPPFTPRGTGLPQGGGTQTTPPPHWNPTPKPQLPHQPHTSRQAFPNQRFQFACRWGQALAERVETMRIESFDPAQTAGMPS